MKLIKGTVHNHIKNTKALEITNKSCSTNK